jgi:ligand-binding SRPBCC domain-containing protein
MYRIYRETIIRTTPQRCFDLSRSIDFHKDSMAYSKEIPIAGKVTGLIELGEFVEWRATHLLVQQHLSSKITEMVKPHYFIDEMISGAFKSFSHRHEVREIDKDTVMLTDDFRYEVPLGLLGALANVLFLRRYMEKIFEIRSRAVKTALETDEWKRYVA